MRLICPNCDAQYEVDDNLVPAEGRDVQCSNCATTWFQAAAGSEVKSDPPPSSDTPSQDALGDDDGDMSASDEAALAATAAAIAGTAAASPAPPSSRMDPEALNVIHEEVARETRAREADRGALETQTDLGLDDTDTEDRAAAARDRMSRSRGLTSHSEIEETTEAVSGEIEEVMDSGAKSELLPDIEEINSTLADAPDPALDATEDGVNAAGTIKSSRRGFRLGFGLVFLILAALIALYVFAEPIGERVPPLAEPLAQYRAAVEAGRIWLDGAAQTLVEQMTGLIGRISGN